MGDKVPPIHVEARVTAGTEERPGSGDDWSGPDASSQRVVHQPGRWARLAALVVLAGLAAGSLLVVLRGGVRDPREAGPDERPPAESARDAYLAAVARLGGARSFAFHGTVQATEPSPLRPGTWLAKEVTVEGAVLLPQSITREVAVSASGATVETVTSGPTAWSRSGVGDAGLADASWEVVAGPDPTLLGLGPGGSDRLGIALVADVLRSARDQHRDPPDASGRRPLRATVPTEGDDERLGDLLAGADVSLVLDDAGNIAHIAITSAPGDGPELALDLAMEQLGESDLITPADVGGPARRTVSLDALEAAGGQALDLDRLPSGWALTEAVEGRAEPSLMCGAGGCGGPREGCPFLMLDYRDLAAVSDGWLTLSVMPESCFADQDGGPQRGEPFRAGAYSGRAEEISPVSVGPLSTTGSVSDGVTRVDFSTDLSTADAAVVLASLVPFDAAADPVPLPGIPSA